MKFKKIALVTLGLMGMMSLANAEVASTTQGCDLNALKANKIVQANFKVSDDPIGLALETKDEVVPATQILANYAKANKCEIYALPMGELVKGLLKGLNTGDAADGQNGASSDESGMSGKYILLQPRKAMCVRELGISLPVKKITATDATTADKKVAK